MSTGDELVVVEVQLSEELLEGVDRYRRRSAHEDRSAVVTAAIRRAADEADHSS